MPHLTEFLTHHAYLTAATFAAGIAVLVYELRARAQDFAGVSATQAVRLINQGALVLDLRARELYDAGHIGDARNVPAAELESQADSLKKWRDRNVITYCDSGQTGVGSARTLARLGFTKVVNLQGGLNAWVKDNLPLVRTKGSGKVSAPVTIYLTGWCPYCARARALLGEKQAAVTEIDIDEDPKLREDMIARSGRRTVPQIFIGDQHVGGCDDLFALDQRGELDRLLQGTA